MELYDIIQKIIMFGWFAYTNRNKILDLAQKHRTVRYMIYPIAIPFTIIVLVIVYNMIRKNPDLFTWSDPQKKLTDYS